MIWLVIWLIMAGGDSRKHMLSLRSLVCALSSRTRQQRGHGGTGARVHGGAGRTVSQPMVFCAPSRSAIQFR